MRLWVSVVLGVLVLLERGAGAGNALDKTDTFLCFAAKATDENLTSENWEYILVSARPALCEGFD